jgi:ribosomal protein L4
MADTTLALDVLKADGTAAGSVELPASIFDVKTNIPLIHQVVVAQLAAVRSRAPAASPSSRRARVTPVRVPSARLR